MVINMSMSDFEPFPFGLWYGLIASVFILSYFLVLELYKICC